MGLSEAVVPPLDSSTTLPTGQRVRTRLPQRGDLPRLRALLAGVGLTADELQLSRWIRFDPRRRVAVVATALVGRTDEVVGFAVLDIDDADPELVVADEQQYPGARAVLEDAARAHRERRIA